jgi:hypothetical protein
VKYKAYSLTFQSDLPLPPLLSIETDDALADVVISQARVSEVGIPAAKNIKAFAQVKENCVWFNAPHIARFQVENGTRIQYEPYANADHQSIGLYILGSCIGAILHQRGFLVLHATAIRVGEGAVLLAGNSGAGKSTTAAVFHQKGFEVMADDVVAIDAKGDAIGGYPRIKLWEDALDKLQLEKNNLSPIRFHINKFSYPLEQGYYEGALPILALYVLSTANENEEFEFQPLEGIAKFNHLKAHTYRRNFMEGLGLKVSHLKLCEQISGQIPVAKIIRPRDRFNAEELTDRILQDLHEKQILVA